MRNHLVVLNQWQEIDQNGYLQSHVGANVQSVFGVPPAERGGTSTNNDGSASQYSTSFGGSADNNRGGDGAARAARRGNSTDSK